MATDNILSRAEVDLFARALYFVATVDGVDDRELKIIEDFCNDAGYPEFYNDIETTKFRPSEANLILDTTDKRRLLLKALYHVVMADGEISQPEELRMLAIADALELSHALDEIKVSVQQ